MKTEFAGLDLGFSNNDFKSVGFLIPSSTPQPGVLPAGKICGNE
jgi:hypothetical protein